MPEANTLSTSPPAHESLDYDFLRARGLEHIERLAHKLWTDFNAHDPGITILEVLAYAITDLGLRTDWDIEDILASHQGHPELGQDFFAQHEVLPNYPWTPLDFRKLIIDFPDVLFKDGKGKEVLVAVQNVWLQRSTVGEVPFYLNSTREGDPKNSDPSYSYTYQADHVPGPKGKAIENALVKLNGLYSTQLLFEENPELSPEHPLFDLNSNSLRRKVEVFGYPGESVNYSINFAYWHQWDASMTGVSSYAIKDILGFEPREKGFLYQVDYHLNGQSNVLHSLTLNLEHAEGFLLENAIANSSRQYYFRAEDWASYMIPNGPNPSVPFVIDVVNYLGNARFEVLGHDQNGSQFGPLFLQCESEWDQITENKVQDIVAALQGASPTSNPVYDYIHRRISQEHSAIMDMGHQFKDFHNLYFQKLAAIREYVEGPRKEPWKGLRHYLCCHRNLCEDWVTFRQVPIEEIGLESNIVLQEGADASWVASEILFRIDRFLSPMVQFETLEELLNQGITPADIFDGPLLKHGFLSDDALQPVNHREHQIFCSDLLRIIMDIPGVEAISHLGISGYVDGYQVVRYAEDCLELECLEENVSTAQYPMMECIRRRPRLDALRSLLTFERDALVLDTNASAVNDRYRDLKLDHLTRRVPQSYQEVDLGGEEMSLHAHQSIQEDFPLIYGIGSEGLEVTASQERRMEARQLKGYLLFFDQLLTNYLAQLSRVRDLFTFRDANPNLENTYFIQPPNSVPEWTDLIDWQGLPGQWWEELESKETYLDRRNRFLSHIAGRFSHTFASYAAKLFTWYKEQSGDSDLARMQSQEALIGDKKAFLQDFPIISSQRGKGFCIRKFKEEYRPDVWDSANVAGMKRRVCRLLGIADFHRRFLTLGYSVASGKDDFFWNPVEYRGRVRWQLFGKGKEELVDGSIYGKPPVESEQVKQFLIQQGANFDNYDISIGRKYVTVYILDGKKRIAALGLRWTIAYFKQHQDEVKAHIDEVLGIFQGMLKPSVGVEAVPEEGFHILEHILFRPRRKKDQLMQIAPGNVQPVMLDVYSMRVTVILPGWAGRFQQAEFRKFVERTLREECPAHIQPWLVWVESEAAQLAVLHELEVAYKEWLEAYAYINYSPATVSGKQVTLVKALNRFHDKFLYSDSFS